MEKMIMKGTFETTVRMTESQLGQILSHLLKDEGSFKKDYQLSYITNVKGNKKTNIKEGKAGKDPIKDIKIKIDLR